MSITTSINSSPEYDYLFKLLILGDSGIGKSAILQQFADNTFTESYISTIGVDFKIRTINFEGKIIKLSCWDAAGQQRFRSIISSYYRGAHGIILVYDVSDQLSFQNLEIWLKEINYYLPGIAKEEKEENKKPNVSMILLGNKCDLLPSQIVVEESRAQEFAEKHDMSFHQVSAKKNINIEKAFFDITSLMIKNNTNHSLPTKSSQNNNIFIKPSSEPINYNSTKLFPSCCT